MDDKQMDVKYLFVIIILKWLKDGMI